MNLLSILLQAPAGGGALQQMVMIVMIIVVFYFFMIRPQMKKQKEQTKFREAVAKGDKVVTLGGIHGKIVSMNDDNTFILESEGTRLRLDKSAISMEATKSINKSESDKK